MDPMNSAKWLLELEITVEAIIRVMTQLFSVFFKLTVFDSKIGVFNNR